MRKSLLHVESSKTHQLRLQYSKGVQLVMKQMKSDLKLVMDNRTEHSGYIEFVRSIISIIRHQNVCPVDHFFYCINPEYSPSSQDPRLQIASILSWGLALEEGDTRASSGLFHLLYASFKISLANGDLIEESMVLRKGMQSPHVFTWMIGRMIPAIMATTVRQPQSWVLLKTYVLAVESGLTEPSIHREIGVEHMMDIVFMINSASATVRELRRLDTGDLQPEHVFILAQITALLNLFGPSAAAFLASEPVSSTTKDLAQAIDGFEEFAEEAEAYTSRLLEDVCSDSGDSSDLMTINPSALLSGIRESSNDQATGQYPQIREIVEFMARDINDTWISDGTRLTVRGPARQHGPSATQSGQGTNIPAWDAEALVIALHKELEEWNWSNGTGRRKGGRQVMIEEDLFF